MMLFSALPTDLGNRSNDYSVPTCYGHREVPVKGYMHEVVIACGSEVVARHPRSYEREAVVFDPLHYLAPPKASIIRATCCSSRNWSCWTATAAPPNGASGRRSSQSSRV